MRLYGYFGRGNLGDEAVQQAWRRAVPALREALVQGPPRLPRGRAVTLFGGGVLQDRSSLRSLLFYALAVRAAARWGPCALSAVGVDVHSRPGRAALARAVPRVHFCSGRDPDSCEALAAAGGRPREARDVALTLPAPPYRGRGSVLVNLTPGVSRAECRAVVASAVQTARVLRADLRGLVLARGEDERVLCGLSLLCPATPAQLMDILSSARVLFAARLHALEFALLCGTPFVAVPVTRKTRAFLRLVERELPRPVPRLPEESRVGWMESADWRRALHRARELLVEEAWTGVNDVREWLRTVA